ncbi:MAG: Mrp/NBP35 family ATP-binding protein [Parachlamydiaceae bacterium]|nr:Mrp/NBP35 family ATP-binding protein [Parachlamydiaceae bacterium]
MPIPMYSSKENKPQLPKSNIKNVVAIAAGKGGVGKSTVAVNLALALQSLGQRVGIFDADIYGPSVRKMLPEERPPSQQGDQLIPAICHGGIRMMSMAYFRTEKEAAAVRAPVATGIIKQFIQTVVWGDLDYLLIDFPPGTGDIQLTLSQQAHLLGALMVTTPQEVALLDVRKAMHLFEQVQVPIVGIVENMSYYQPAPTAEKVYLFGRSGGRKLAQATGVPFLGEVPIDPEICRCGDSGGSLIANQNATQGAQAFIALAKGFMEEVDVLKKLSEDTLQNFELTWREMPNVTTCHSTN